MPWPDALAQRYRDAGVWAGQPLSAILTEQAQRNPQQCALIEGAEQCTYLELKQRVDQFTAGLQHLGLQAGDTVLLQLPNSIAAVVVFFALQQLGVIPVMALPAHRLSELRSFCQQAQPKAYIGCAALGRFDCQPMVVELLQRGCIQLAILAGDVKVPLSKGVHRLADLYRDVKLDMPALPHASDVALLQLSGGTTGVPKLIPRTHDDYFYSVRCSAQLCQLGAETVYLAVLPMAHNFPLSSPGVLGTLWAGGCVVFAQSAAPDECFALITQHKVSITALVPPLALVWLDVAQRLQQQGDWPFSQHALQVLQVGGAKFSAAAAQRVTPVLGCTLQQVFGMAEGLVNYTRLDDPLEWIITTQGRPMSEYDQIRVVDAQDNPVTIGQVGHLLTQGPYTIRGYLGGESDPKLQSHFTADGFYRTGDEVRLTPQGYLVVEGRSKDQINRGGEKIAAEEVENHLLAHPAIHDAAVVAMPDAFLGEKSCAFVMAHATQQPLPRAAELLAFLRERQLADFKLPDRIEWIEAFPLTHLGKVNKQQLRQIICDPLQLFVSEF